MAFLKQLELENFKSYKGRQIVGPFYRFTAIIGPNGSGKSNLMDAISFVLGERTQNLRVRTLRDLIHGAPIGKPVASKAKVTAVCEVGEEGDRSEVAFTRMVRERVQDRQQAHLHSEMYELTMGVVSPAQYQARLEAMGILIKAKNFLVFQGAVESIAMKTAKERTKLFEEISRSGELAGEYENKKKSMQQAQEETNFSYHKKRGIAMEKKEARAEKEEAEKYQKLQDDHADAQLQEQLFKLYHNERQIDDLVEQVKTKQKELDKLISRRGKLENQMKTKKQESAKWSRETAVVEKKKREKEMEMNKLKPLFIKAKEQTLHVVKRMEASKKAQKKAIEKQSNHEKEIAALESELETVRCRAEQFEDEMAEESQGVDVQLMASQVAEYNQLKAKARKKTTMLNEQLRLLQRKHQDDEQALETHRLKKQDLQARQQYLKEQRTQLEQRIEEMDSSIKKLSEELHKKRGDYDKLSEEVRQANLRYRELNESLETVHRKLGDARVDSQESSRQQRRAEILERLMSLYSGVYGRLIDLCEPKDKKYALALTKVLGRNMDAIVVEHEKTCKDCISYIKEQHGDPVTFIPLDTIEVKPINQSLRQLGKQAQLVIDVIKVSTDKDIQKALQFACGNALLCQTMEEARRLAFGGGERRKVVSLDGTLFQKSGVISGGASDLKAKAKRWDEKQVEALKRQRGRIVDDLKTVTQTRRREADLQTLESEVSGHENRLNMTKRSREIAMEQSLAGNQRELDLVERELQQMEPQRKELKASLDAHSAELAKLQSKIDKVEDEVFCDFCASIGVANIRQYEEKQLKGQQAREEKRLEFTNLQQRLQNQLEFERQKNPAAIVRKYARTIATDEKSIAELKREEKDKEKAIDKLEEAIDQLRQQIADMMKQAEEHNGEIQELRKMLSTHIKDITALQKKISTLETGLEQKRADRHSLLKGCKMEAIKLPMKRGRMEDIGDEEGNSMATQSEETGSTTAMMDIDSMSSQGARMLYERESHIVINYSKLDEDLKDLDDDNDIRKMTQELNGKVTRLQSTLQRINAPNMRALEKLEGVEARLQETSEAFEHSRQQAKKTKTDFEKIKKLRFDRFTEAFEHVSGVIDDIYKKLSNNTSAQAFLGVDNGEEPYLEGVSYNCIAPGKRFRPMDNLSGGEKTVAALALLFAVQSYQPAPFFVLDEIDAALDNTNINRVANYITQRAGGFQFIVISLKEEFYCHADALIGIFSEVGGECTISHTLTHDLTQYPVSTSGASPAKSKLH